MACSYKLLECLFMSPLLAFVISSSFVDPESSADVLQKKAEYHLGELKSTILQLQASHRRSKRDTTRSVMSVDFSDSLQDICSNFHLQTTQDPSTNYRTPSTTIDHERYQLKNNITYEGENDPSKWNTRGIQLISVEKERRDNTLHLAFNITHWSQVIVIRTLALDPIIKIGPQGKYSEPVSSVFRHSIHASECTGSNPYSIYFRFDTARITFGLVEDKECLMHVEVQMCDYDEGDGGLSNGKEAIEDEKVEGEISYQQFAPSQFRVQSSSFQNDNEILIKPGVNPEFYVDIDFSEPRTAFAISADLWDWDKEETRHSYSVIRKDDNHSVWEDGALLSFMVVNRAVIDISTDTDEINDANSTHRVNRTVVRAKITALFGSRKISGRLLLGPVWMSDDDVYPIGAVRETRYEQGVLLRLPYKLSALPSNSIVHDYLHAGSAGCERREGNQAQNSANTCVIYCGSEGTDIERIFIVKNEPYAPPVKSVSTVTGGYVANAFVDMGPPTAAIEGEYRCNVVTKNGTVKSYVTTLVSVSYTVVHFVTVTDMGNGTALVTCEASGFQPLRIGLDLMSDNNNVIKPGLQDKVFTLETNNNTSTLRALVDIKLLLFPTATVLCSASGEGGNARNSTNLPMNLEIYNATVPKVVKDLFSMKHYENETTRISCTASGGEDLAVNIITPNHFGHPHEIFHTDTNTDGVPTKTTVLYLPTQVVSNRYLETRVRCEARNKRGGVIATIDKDNIQHV